MSLFSSIIERSEPFWTLLADKSSSVGVFLPYCITPFHLHVHTHTRVLASFCSMRTDLEVTRYEASYSVSRFQHWKSRVSRQAVARVTFAYDIAIYMCSVVQCTVSAWVSHRHSLRSSNPVPQCTMPVGIAHKHLPNSDPDWTVQNCGGQYVNMSVFYV